MSILLSAPARSPTEAGATLSPNVARGLFVFVVCAAATVGVMSTDAATAHAATADAGADLTRLLRLMTLIKAALAAAAVGAAVWRLGWPVSSVRLAFYALAGAATAAGPGLIWSMAHVGLGALLLHAGLVATVVLLWRDPTVSKAMSDAVKRRS